MALPNPSTPAVSFQNAVALSGRFPLLAGVDLEVAPGEAVLIEGPNGAGKTSLLRVCAGLVSLASGQVSVFGLDPAHQRNQVRRRIGMLSHASHLYDDLTVRENVRFGVRAAGAALDRVGPACDRLGLVGRLLRTPASKLSAGQRRRVALAILAARWPDLWLLDEPHAGLDASTRQTLDELVGEARASGVTVLLASHESEVVESLATRAVTVIGGRVTAERVLLGPQTRSGVGPSPLATPMLPTGVPGSLGVPATPVASGSSAASSAPKESAVHVA